MNGKACAVLIAALFIAATPASAELYSEALRSHDDTRAQNTLEGFSTAFGTPFLGVRALFALPGAAVAELGNGLIWALDQPLPGTLPHAEPGWLWEGALRSLRDDWNESTPGYHHSD